MGKGDQTFTTTNPALVGLFEGKYKGIVEAFDESPDINCPHSQYINKIFRKIASQEPTDDLLKELDAFDASTDDIALLTVFYLAWSHLSYHSRPEQAYQLVDRAKALARENVYLKEHVKSYEVFFLLWDDNLNLLKQKIAIDDSSDLKDIRTAARYMSFFGMCKDVSRFEEMESDPDFKYSYHSYKYFDAVENFDFDEAQYHLEKCIAENVNDDYEARSDMSKPTLFSHLCLLQCFLKKFGLDEKRYPALNIHKNIEGLQEKGRLQTLVHIKSLDYMVQKRPLKALKNHALSVENKSLDKILGFFYTYNHCRVELACGNAVAAMKFIREQQTKGLVHYLDDFFQARAVYLLGQVDTARQLFRWSLKGFRQYGINRFNVEMMLSSELDYSDLFLLMEGDDEVVHENLPSKVEKKTALEMMVGRDEKLNTIKSLIPKYAATDAPVLILGETGTGKELVAHALHECGPRSDRKFMAINCGAITPSLLQSELFGHEQGAFSGAVDRKKGYLEMVEDGTLFLDEVGELSDAAQVSLLRVLENGEFNRVGGHEVLHTRCKIIAATNRDLEREVIEKRFRQDLLYRLNRLVLLNPPLRDRLGDLEEIMRYFVMSSKMAGTKLNFDPALIEAFKDYDWPGNIRECRNEMEWLTLMHSEKNRYGLKELSPDMQSRLGKIKMRKADMPNHHDRGMGAKMPTMRRREKLRELFREKREMNVSAVVEELGVSKNTAISDLKILREERFIDKVTPSGAPSSHYFKLRAE